MDTSIWMQWIHKYLYNFVEFCLEIEALRRQIFPLDILAKCVSLFEILKKWVFLDTFGHACHSIRNLWPMRQRTNPFIEPNKKSVGHLANTFWGIFGQKGMTLANTFPLIV